MRSGGSPLSIKLCKTLALYSIYEGDRICWCTDYHAISKRVGASLNTIPFVDEEEEEIGKFSTSGTGQDQWELPKRTMLSMLGKSKICTIFATFLSPPR
jgi:hypothetical protein